MTENELRHYEQPKFKGGDIERIVADLRIVMAERDAAREERDRSQAEVRLWEKKARALLEKAIQHPGVPLGFLKTINLFNPKD